VSEPAVNRDRRQRLYLIALALLFFAPLGLAFYLYYGPAGWRPAGRVNHGELIDPPRPLPSLALALVAADPVTAGSVASSRSTDPDFLKQKWTLLYFGPGTCSRRCRTTLYNTRQVRTALNRDQGRVQRVFIAVGACCDMEFLRIEHPDLITIRVTPAAAPLLALLPEPEDSSAVATGRIYLVDPLGNLILAYAPEANPKGMLEDLQRLIRLSHVG
jgi:cytochrome oxidase Cu insertion factor (SCO1/SenC/PrrC family)